MSEMATQSNEDLLEITKAEININGLYKTISDGNKKAATLLAVMERMKKLTALVFNLLPDDKGTFDRFLLDLSKYEARINVDTILIENYRPKSEYRIKFASYLNKNIVKLEIKNSTPVCGCGYTNLTTLTIRFDYFDENTENVDYNDTRKLLEQLPDAPIKINIFVNNFIKFVRLISLLEILKDRKSVEFLIHYGVSAVVWGRQKMKQLTLEHMHAVDKEIADKDHIILKANHLYILKDLLETIKMNKLDALVFDYLDIYVDDMRDEECMISLKELIANQIRMKRLDVVVRRLLGDLHTFWSKMSTEILGIEEFSIKDDASVDCIRRIVSDGNTSTLLANIQSGRYYKLPLDHTIILHLGEGRKFLIEQLYIDWFRTRPFDPNYKVINNGKGRIINAANI